jgi:hypothetical protein
VSLDGGGQIAGCGRHSIDPSQLVQFREALDAPRSGGQVVAMVAALRKKKYEVAGQELKRVPPPYPQDHPRGELLRHKRLIYWRRWEIAPWLATAAARERVAQAWRDGTELNDWLALHLGPEARRA